MAKIRFIYVVLIFAFAIALTGCAGTGEQAPPADVPVEEPAESSEPYAEIANKFLDVSYGDASEMQKLNIFMPEGAENTPILVFIHGGGFAIGNRTGNQVTKLLAALDQGYGLVSLDYRLSGEAIFPAAVLDCRQAIRFLKLNAAEYGIDPNRIAVIGSSAGGNLSAMLAMNIPTGEFYEEESAEYLDIDTNVVAAIDWFGPLDFLTMDDQMAALGHEINTLDESSFESKYIGVNIADADPELVGLANPMNYISSNMAYILIQHGTADVNVPITQSEIFAQRIEEIAGADRVEFIPIEGAQHEGPQFTADENLPNVWAFLSKHL